MKIFLSIITLLGTFILNAQSLYFPPTSFNDTSWQKMSLSDARWCENELDTLLDYLESKETKAFIILKDGKIIVEKYFGNFKVDSFWYWASAGKTLTATLVGIAQTENILNINNKTSDYLGNGWTNTTIAQENLITVKNQLSMTTGLDFNEPDDNCTIDTCLNYKSDAGTEWYYYNAPYRLLQDVVESASGSTFNQYTRNKLTNKIGMIGQWVDYVYYSKARDMARFGLLMLNKGIWQNDIILNDSAYYNDMVNTSQNLNESYGYLWWLNGKNSFKIPGTTLTFQGSLMPDAPDDLIAALGLNDQKIHVVPSQNLVLIRMGNSAGQPVAAVSSFDNEIWQYLNQVMNCNITSTKKIANNPVNFYPNPATNFITITSKEAIQQTTIFNNLGIMVLKGKSHIDISQLPQGKYIALIQFKDRIETSKFLKQ
jgi:CubicO group peptidase (beta-lactamase class C family)